MSKGERTRFMVSSMLVHVLLFCQLTSFSQDTFEFVNKSAGARLDAMGGVNASYSDRDVNFLFSNPALVGDTLSGFGSASALFYVADIVQSSVVYAHQFNRTGLFALGVQHMDYGTINAYDAAGGDLGTFKAGETLVVIGKSHQLGVFRLGVNLKGAFSSLAGYRSTAMMVDLGGVFVHPDKDFTAGLLIKNMGVVFGSYSETSDPTLPFDVQAGITFKPEHMPVRFSVTAYDLDGVGSAQAVEELSGLDRVFRHLNFGAEVLVHRNVNLLAGYNIRRHQDLTIESGGGLSGFSFGVNARINSFEFIVSRSSYVRNQAGYAFSLILNFNNIIR